MSCRATKGSLREMMRAGIDPDAALHLFFHLLDGVEAAHLKGAVHRDLKPENVLHDASVPPCLAVADFGVALFSDEQLLTAVETKDGARLANFEYAAPEQRRRGGKAGVPADIFALGLMVNEMFTGQVPHGAGYRRIADVSSAFRYLDPLVEAMIQQDPAARPQSIQEVKHRIRLLTDSDVVDQRLSTLTNTVVRDDAVDHPLVTQPLKIVDADWGSGVLTLKFDRAPTEDWIHALRHMGNASYIMGTGPDNIEFRDAQARIHVDGPSAQAVVNQVKGWIPTATQVLAQNVKAEQKRKATQERERVARERAVLEEQQRVRATLRI